MDDRKEVNKSPVYHFMHGFNFHRHERDGSECAFIYAVTVEEFHLLMDPSKVGDAVKDIPLVEDLEFCKRHSIALCAKPSPRRRVITWKLKVR